MVVQPKWKECVNFVLIQSLETTVSISSGGCDDSGGSGRDSEGWLGGMEAGVEGKVGYKGWSD